MKPKPKTPAPTAALRRRAEALLRQRQTQRRAAQEAAKSATDPQRQFHELQVHQVELEMQNTELQEARDRMEMLLEKYTDLYDFAPVGYFSLDESGAILEANLTGAALLGIERSRLISRRLPLWIAPTSRPTFLTFLETVFASPGKQFCEAMLLREDGTSFWAGLHGTSALATGSDQKWGRVAVSDITERKRAEDAQRRLDVLTASNRKLEQEIVHRQAVEQSLKQSQQHQNLLLEQAHHLQKQLRQLSHQILHTQEEERKRISRELHDEIAQILVGINIHLAALTRQTPGNSKGLRQQIARTQRLVEKSVARVHQFARELRPKTLDDLGLIPALHAFMKEFTKRTGVRTRLTTFATVEQLDIASRTVLYRVAHEALTNVERHAQASQVEVQIENLPDRICLKIKDDGKSFNAERALHANGGKRLGLLGMRERLEMVGGNFSVASAPGKGTTVLAQIPAGKAARGGGGAKFRG